LPAPGGAALRSVLNPGRRPDRQAHRPAARPRPSPPIPPGTGKLLQHAFRPRFHGERDPSEAAAGTFLPAAFTRRRAPRTCALPAGPGPVGCRTSTFQAGWIRSQPTHLSNVADHAHGLRRAWKRTCAPGTERPESLPRSSDDAGSPRFATGLVSDDLDRSPPLRRLRRPTLTRECRPAPPRT